MKKWPWWVLLSVGGALGATATWVVIRGSSVLGTPAWDEAVAWQGWAGSLVAALLTVLVAWVVFRGTIEDGRDAARESRLIAATEQLLNAIGEFVMTEFPKGEHHPAASALLIKKQVWLLHLDDAERAIGMHFADRLDDAIDMRVLAAGGEAEGPVGWGSTFARLVVEIRTWQSAPRRERIDETRWIRRSGLTPPPPLR